ncbi:hypothetical protein LIS82_27680 (plasmid) [Cytobacillus solani]|uniref:hypothetical protein n=1 Tax=Cytobacillus solani TaxID=1637975 RepID=UPI002079BD12|nr:hypothetical protein [Cytobacillus solani]USK57757.1 hypothetical protein LIS82_27680 [Cytobacillus solani]
MKTWDMIKKSVQGDIWYSEVLWYPIIHTHKGFVPLNSKANHLKQNLIILKIKIVQLQ